MVYMSSVSSKQMGQFILQRIKGVCVVMSECVSTLNKSVAKKSGVAPFFFLMCGALFAIPTDFVPTGGYRAEAFGFTDSGALSDVSKSALAPSWCVSGRSWRRNSRKRSWSGSGCSVHAPKFSFVGLDRAFALNLFHFSAQRTFDEASEKCRRSREAQFNFTGIANLVRSVGATCNGVHVVRIFETDGAIHFATYQGSMRCNERMCFNFK